MTTVDERWDRIAAFFGTDAELHSDPWDAFLSHLRLLHSAALKEMHEEEEAWLTIQTVSHDGVRRTHSIDFVRATFEDRAGVLFDRLLDERPWDGWFTPLGLQHTRPERKRSANASNSHPAYSLFLDLDINGGEHKLDGLPGVNRALRIIETFEEHLGAFAGVISTGGGVHLYLPLKAPADAVLVRQWRTLIEHVGTIEGVHIDALSNLGSQLVRVGGSASKYNRALVRWAALDAQQEPLSTTDALGLVNRALALLGYQEPVKQKPTGALRSVERRDGEGSSPGARFNAAVSPLALLQALVPLTKASSTGRWSYGDSSDTHVQVNDDGSLVIWGQRLAADLNAHGGSVRTGYGYRSAHTLANDLYAGATFDGFGGRRYELVATTVINAESRGLGTSGAVNIFRDHPSAASLEAEIRANR